MHINLFIFPFIIILGFVLERYDSPKARKLYIFIVSTVLILETSLRSLSVGSDTLNYYYMFNYVREMSWNELWEQFIERYFNNTSEEDIGYSIMQKVIASVTSSWQVFVFIANLTFFIPLGILMHRYSNKMIQLIFAYVLYVAIFHIISLSGGRQLYAIGMSIMSFIYLNEKKYTKSILFILIGATIHFSALLSFLPLILSRWNVKFIKPIHLFSLILVPITINFVNQIIMFMGSAVGIEKYENYAMGGIAGGAWTFISILVVASVFIYFAIKRKDLQQNKSLSNLYTMVPLFTFFGPLIHSNGSMIRISMYFHLYLMLLLPLAIEKTFKGSTQTIIYIYLIVVLLMLSLRNGGLVYHFFWQEPHLFY